MAVAHPSPPASSPRERAGGWRLALLWVVPMLLALLVWAPLVDNQFFGDDFVILFHLRDRSPFEFLLRPHGWHLYGTTGAVFLVADALFGPQPRPLFWLVLCTHVVNVGLLFAVIRRLAGSDRLACLGAVLWGTSPVLEAALGWLAVYGQVLVATATFCLLWHLARLADGARASAWAPVGWALLLLAAVTSFGVGIGIALAMPLAAWLILPPGPTRRAAVPTMAGVALATVATYVVISRYVALRGSGGYGFLASMDFWTPTMGFVAHLFGYATGRALTGTLAPAAPYPGPAAALLAGAGAALLVAALARGPRALRRRTMAVLIVAAGGYGLIAAGRAIFLGGGAAAGRVNRYHYLGLALVVTALCIAGSAVTARWRVPQRLRDGALALAIGVLVVAWARSAPRIDHHDDVARQAQAALRSIDRVIDAVPPGDSVFVSNSPFAGLGPLYTAKTVFPGWAGLFVIYHPDNTVRGRPVYFIEPSWQVRETMRGRRTAGLLVSQTPLPSLPGP
ncbi:hypothetical protein KF840_18055 [bacterium]|nr:hypothetical protein [bacterium]